MTVLLLSFLFFLLAVTGLAVGLLCGRESLRGSCGGLNRIPGIEADCQGCGRRCRGRQRETE